MPTIASSAAGIPQSRIRELAEAAMRMDGVLKLYFGESNIPTPDYIKRAASAALVEGYTFYTQNAGLPGLRQDLAEYYGRLHGVTLDPLSEIVVVASGVQALKSPAGTWGKRPPSSTSSSSPTPRASSSEQRKPRSPVGKRNSDGC